MKFYIIFIMIVFVNNQFAFSQNINEKKWDYFINADLWHTDHRGKSMGVSANITCNKLFFGFGVRYLHNQAFVPVFADYIKIRNRMYATNLSERLIYDFKIGKSINNNFFKWGHTNLYYRLSVMKGNYRNEFYGFSYYDSTTYTTYYETKKLNYSDVWSIDNGIGLNHKAKLFKNLYLNFDFGLGIIYYNGINYNEYTKNAIRGSYQLGLGISYKIEK